MPSPSRSSAGTAGEGAVRAGLAEAFRNAAAKGQVRPLDPLPRRVRLRLWLTRRADGAAIWLAGHDHNRVAIGLWRACRLWGRRSNGWW